MQKETLWKTQQSHIKSGMVGCCLVKNNNATLHFISFCIEQWCRRRRDLKKNEVAQPVRSILWWGHHAGFRCSLSLRTWCEQYMKFLNFAYAYYYLHNPWTKEIHYEWYFLLWWWLSYHADFVPMIFSSCNKKIVLYFLQLFWDRLQMTQDFAVSSNQICLLFSYLLRLMVVGRVSVCTRVV